MDVGKLEWMPADKYVRDEGRKGERTRETEQITMKIGMELTILNRIDETEKHHIKILVMGSMGVGK